MTLYYENTLLCMRVGFCELHGERAIGGRRRGAASAPSLPVARSLSLSLLLRVCRAPRRAA
eukprot:scaffold166462_cov30-Tisochrysis_lutea.AAC.4